MKIEARAEVFDVLKMPYEEFKDTVRVEAKEIHKAHNGDSVIVKALLGYNNVCKNNCTYCGMRAGMTDLKRYRMDIEDVHRAEDCVKKLGINRIFLISGEDPKYSFRNILSMVEYGKELGLRVSLAMGDLSPEQFRDLESAGLDEYVLKFETTNKELFDKLKPTADYNRRMANIEIIKNSKMALASGNIISFPHQTLEDIADDIMLMKKLEISWAPVIPYMPVPNTPLALEGSRGSLEITMKEISLLRIMMPSVNITAQQPGEDMKNGLADVQGNLDALNAGANVLFVDVLPKGLVEKFSVISNRMIKGIENVNNLVKMSDMTKSM